MMGRRKPYILLLICFLHLSIGAIGQWRPDIEWQYNYGGSQSDLSHSIMGTSDGGFIIAGHTDSNNGDVIDNHGARDIWVLKLRADGTIEWQRCYGGTGSEHGSAMIIETVDGGYILGGTTESNDGDVSCDVLGSMIWILKLDAIGNIVWQRCLGGSGLDAFGAVRLTYDGGYVVTGLTYSSDGDAIGNHGLMDRIVIKLNADGSTEWSQCYGGSDLDSGSDVKPTLDGGFITCGYTRSNDGDIAGQNPYYVQPFLSSSTGWIIKLDNEGEIQWQQCIGGNNNDGLRRIVLAGDGSYWFVGTTASNNGHVSGNSGQEDGWLVRISSEGEFIDQRCFGGSMNDYFMDARIVENDAIVMIGYSHSADGIISDPFGGSDVWMLMCDPELEPIWSVNYGGSLHESGVGLHATDNGGLVFTGYSASNDGDLTGNNGDIDLWVVKLAPWEVGIAEHNPPQALHLYPSPVQDLLQVEWDGPQAAPLHWTIVDLTGRAVAQGRSAGERWSVPVAHLAPGTYVMLVHGPKGLITGRFVKA